MSNSWLVVDANLVIRLVADPADAQVQTLWDEWMQAGRRLAAPTLLAYEVTSVLHRYARLGYLSANSVRLALDAAFALPIELHGDVDLHWRALELATSLDLPAAYDAHYLALAQRLGAEFWTGDGRLAGRVQDVIDGVRSLPAP